MSDDARIAALQRLLREAGVGTGACADGAQADIAIVYGAQPSEVQPLAERIRALGFRHVTVDLATLGREARD